MYSSAAGQRSLTFSCSCTYVAGGSAIRAVSRRGEASASSGRNSAVRLAAATKRPWTWQARIRSISITGVWLASESAKPCFTAATIEGRFGRGSSSQTCDFIAKACVRSCMIDEPSP